MRTLKIQARKRILSSVISSLNRKRIVQNLSHFFLQIILDLCFEYFPLKASKHETSGNRQHLKVTRWF